MARKPWQWPSPRRVIWSLVVFSWGLITGLPLGASLEIPMAFRDTLLLISAGLMLVFLYGVMFLDGRRQSASR